MSKRRAVTEAMGELNLVPYMDIVVNLILFLMMSSSGLLAFGAINVSAPPIGSEEPAEPGVNLEVHISATGFSVVGRELSREIVGHDYAALTRYLADVKAQHRSEEDITIVGAGDISYAVLVRVMDAARSDGTQALFPNVILRPSL